MDVGGKKKNSSSTRRIGDGLLLDSKKEELSGSLGSESKLATQLQNAWLQTQLPRPKVPNVDFLSPVPQYRIRSSPDLSHQLQIQHQFAKASLSSSFSPTSPLFTRSSSNDSPESSSEASTKQYSDVSERGSDSPEPMEEDVMLRYLEDMLMEEDLPNQKCMYVQCSSYQAMEEAMTKELGDLLENGKPMTNEFANLIQNESPTQDNAYPTPSSFPITTLDNKAGKDTTLNSWIDEVFNLNPNDFLGQAEVRESDGGTSLVDQVSSMAGENMSGVTGSSPRSVASAPNSAGSSVACASNSATSAVVVANAGTGLYDRYDVPYLNSDPILTPVDYANGRSGIESLEELYPLLMQCAQAVSSNDLLESHRLLGQLRLTSSPFGDGGQRLAHYVGDALLARLSGSGAKLYTALTSSRPNAVEMLKAYRDIIQYVPAQKMSHGCANHTIVTATKGVDRVHIIDYGILNGMQWSMFLAKASRREGGPPFVRITGIDFAEPGFQKNDRLDGTGRRLTAIAKELGVEFEFHAIAGKWELITAAQLALRDDETLVVNSMLRLKNVLDETVIASNPRKMVLSRIRSLNPKLFVIGVQSGGYNSPFFLARFKETINYFAAKFDLFHSSMHPDSESRHLAEKEVLGREILNIIACEGTERIERAETYRQWHSRCINAGFKQRPLEPGMTGKASNFLKNFNRNFGVAVDGHWLLNGWKDTVLHAVTSWVPD